MLKHRVQRTSASNEVNDSVNRTEGGIQSSSFVNNAYDQSDEKSPATDVESINSESEKSILSQQRTSSPYANTLAKDKAYDDKEMKFSESDVQSIHSEKATSALSQPRTISPNLNAFENKAYNLNDEKSLRGDAQSRQSARLKSLSRTTSPNVNSFANKTYDSFDDKSLKSDGVSITSERAKSRFSMITLSTVDQQPWSRNTTLENTTLESIREEIDDKSFNETETQEYVSYKGILNAAIIIIAILCISFAVGFYFIGYYPEHGSLNVGDVRIIDYSTYFCSAVSTDTSDTRLTVLSNAKRSKVVRYTINMQLSMEVGQTWHRMLYLFKNSEINMKVNSKEMVDVLTFQSKKKFEIWRGRKESKTFLLKESCCLESTENPKNLFKLRAIEDDYYYIVFHRGESFGSRAYLNISFEFVRPSFDFTTTTEQCVTTSTSKTCSVPLSYASNEETLIETVHKHTKQSFPLAVEVKWKCEARIWFYFLAFGLIFILFALVALGIYHVSNKYVISRYLKFTAKKRKEASLYTVEFNDRQKRGSTFSVLNDSSILHSTNEMRPSSACDSFSANEMRQPHPRDSLSTNDMRQPYPRDSVSYESIEKYHSWAIDDNSGDSSDMKKGENGQFDNRSGVEMGNRNQPMGIATIYRNEKQSDVNRHDSNVSIIKYVAKKPSTQEVEPQSESSNELTVETGKLKMTSSIGTSSPREAASSGEIILRLPEENEMTIERRKNGDKAMTEDKHHDLHAKLSPTRSTGYFRVLSPRIKKKTGEVMGQRERRSPNPIFFRPVSQFSSTEQSEVVIGKSIDI
eukprot:Seg2297.4 transcript_id=Seg2297.4/GoldUCD/mRNA.D3Y31 product="hypothetical protein" protein_id=Seg2297.4/GoldUCD/D3Y31